MIYNESKLHIQLFQDFIIEYQGVQLHMHEILSKQILNLMEILILHNGRSVPKERLIEFLWENNDNPESALKFNIFRLRKLLKEIPELANINMIRTDKNGYRFDPDVTWSSDCGVIEELHDQLKNKKEFLPQDYVNMNTIQELYIGKLYHSGSIIWFVQREEYFRKIYLAYITPLCEYYLKHNEYEEVQQIAQKAVILEPSIENNHYYFVLSFVKEEEYAIAYEHYQNAVERLSSEFETEPSKRLLDLYHKIINDNIQKRSPNEIMTYYRDMEFSQGAYYCTSSVFDYLYEMRVRSAQREHTSIYLYVFELDNRQIETLDDSMKKLKNSIIHCLRGSDVFTKLNRSQFLVLLSCPTQEVAYQIAQRVNAYYRNKKNANKNTLYYHLCLIND